MLRVLFDFVYRCTGVSHMNLLLYDTDIYYLQYYMLGKYDLIQLLSLLRPYTGRPISYCFVANV